MASKLRCAEAIKSAGSSMARNAVFWRASAAKMIWRSAVFRFRMRI
jgi:hypothetical protein